MIKGAQHNANTELLWYPAKKMSIDDSENIVST